MTSDDLPAPLGPNQRDHLAALHREIDIVEHRLDLAFAFVGKAHMLEPIDSLKPFSTKARFFSCTSSCASMKRKISSLAPIAC